jgi:hypothetical protein
MNFVLQGSLQPSTNISRVKLEMSTERRAGLRVKCRLFFFLYFDENWKYVKKLSNAPVLYFRKIVSALFELL